MAAKHASPLEALLVEDDLEVELLRNEPLSRHTSYRIGGPARFFLRVDSLGSLMRILTLCEQRSLAHVVLGRGTNILAADEGFDGVVMVLGKQFREFSIDEEGGCIIAGAGVQLSSIVQEAFRASLAGMEFAVGTPGSLGGALRMNAGSRDEGIGSRVRTVTTYAPGRGLTKRYGEEIEWGYRSSSFAEDETIVECELIVEKADSFFIRGKMEANLARRKKTQPLGLPSCGSVFKNPEGMSVARLIEEVGLKGTVIGGAQISEQHANFIVNRGGARAADVVALMDLIESKVEEAYGIKLSPEVRFLGFE